MSTRDTPNGLVAPQRRKFLNYLVKPVRDLPRGCREIELRSERRGQPYSEIVTACRSGRGEWNIRR